MHSEAKLIVTIFHHATRTNSFDSSSKPSSDPSVSSDLDHVFMQLPVPEQDIITTQPAPGVSRYILRPNHPEILNCKSLRHSESVKEFENNHAVEIIFDLCPSVSSTGQRPLKLALFDMDSTLINEEVIDELARSIGISDAVSAITARAMNGDIDFATSLKERVAMLKGVPTTVWDNLKKTVTIAEGAKDLILGLKKRGVYTGVVSGGFTPMAEWLRGELGLDVALANHLIESPPTDDFPFPHLSGELNPDFPIVTPELKESTLFQLSAEHSIPLSETLAVGDGSNDLLMLGAAGLGVAWRAKTKVQAAAPMRLNGESLADLLYLLG